MSELDANLRYKKRRRTILLSMSLLALLAASGLVLGVIENIRDAFDRAH